MTPADKLTYLRSKYKDTLKTRTGKLKARVTKLSARAKLSDNKRILNSIDDEIHKLVGSARPYGYLNLSNKVKEIQQLVQAMLAEKNNFNVDMFEQIKSLISQLDSEIEKDETADVNNPQWSLISKQTEEDKINGINKKIILIDEDEEFTDLLSLQLEEFGYEVIVLYDFSKFEKILKELNPSTLIIDSLLLQSEPNYLELIKRLREEELFNFSLIYLSLDTSFQARLDAIRSGADGYFIKPINITEFISFLDNKTSKAIVKPLRVLIIDDDTEMAQLNALSLQQNNVKTFIINDPVNTISAMVSFKPDLLLMDIQMPNCNGFELAQIIRQNNDFINIPIIFLSSQNIEDAWVHSKESGGDDFISKDISTEHLVNTITARAKRSRTLIEATKIAADKQARFDAFSETVIDAIIVTDSERRIVSWNKGAENLLGYSEQEVFGHHISIIFTDKEQKQLRKAIEKNVSENGHPFANMTYVGNRLHKDGHEIPCEILYSEWEYNGEVNHTGVYRDIRPRLNLEKKLKEKIRELDFQKKTLDEHAIVSIADVKGNITYVNDKFCDVSGYSQKQLLGNNHNIVKSGEHSKEFFKDLWKTISNGKPWHGTITNRKRDGTLYWVQSTIVPFTDETGKPFQYVAIRTDITEQKKNEKKLANYHTELENEVAEQTKVLHNALNEVVEANQTKSKFIANMSHELRTPLNAIIGFSELIGKQYLGKIENPKYVEYAYDISSSSKHLLDMINGILNIERISADKFPIQKEKFDFTHIINDGIPMLEQQAQNKKIKINITVAENLPPLLADRKAIAQIFINLLSNAVKFSHKNSSIEIDASYGAGEHVLKFIDHGEGILPELIENITTPFYRHQSNPHIAYDGIGLGLSISKSLAELHGGTLKIESEHEKGTTVTVTIPNTETTD